VGSSPADAPPDRDRDSRFVAALVPRLAAIPGVVAVALGGSRASGTEQPDSDWDFGLYYRGVLDTAAVRALGFEGVVVEPGEWGRLVNGGAWLTVEGRRVDLLYRDLAVVEHWTHEAEAGRYERDHVEGYIGGMATYVLAGELALNRVLHGTLPRPPFPALLADVAPTRWFRSAAFSLDVASTFVARGDRAGAIGLAAKALVALAQGVIAARREWVLNEKGIATRAGLSDLAELVSPGASTFDATTSAIRARLGDEVAAHEGDSRLRP
jgi:predicted nucleotidyltransferase